MIGQLAGLLGQMLMARAIAKHTAASFAQTGMGTLRTQMQEAQAANPPTGNFIQRITRYVSLVYQGAPHHAGGDDNPDSERGDKLVYGAGDVAKGMGKRAGWLAAERVGAQLGMPGLGLGSLGGAAEAGGAAAGEAAVGEGVGMAAVGAAGALGMAAVGAGALAAGFAVVVATGDKLAFSQVAAARGLAQFNGSIANAFAKVDANDIRRNMASGVATAGTTTTLVTAVEAMRDEIRPISDTITNGLNYFAAWAVEFSTPIIKFIGRATTLVNKWLGVKPPDPNAPMARNPLENTILGLAQNARKIHRPTPRKPHP